MKTYNKETFEEYLKRKHFEDEPMTLDDDMENAYERWLEWQGIDLVIAYAEAWHVEQKLADLNK